MNRETYNMLSIEFKAVCHSVSMAKSGRYCLTKTDLKRGYYVTLEELGITLKLGFRALFETNDKIAPIRSLSFINAFDCPSAKRGLCQLCNNKELCYARAGHLRASGTYRTKGQFKGCTQINSLQSAKIVSRALDAIYSNKALLKLLINYIDVNIPILRFNLKGDFRSRKDINFIKLVAEYTEDTILYGYSARDDILSPTEFDAYYHRVFLNGSNKKYTNRFEVVTDLKEYFKASFICHGGCKGCGNCYYLVDTTIKALLHGKGSDEVLNTLENREFLATLMSALGYTMTPKDLTVNKGLYRSLKKQFELRGLTIPFDSLKDLKEFLDSSHYDLKDFETVDYETLKSLGVA